MEALIDISKEKADASHWAWTGWAPLFVMTLGATFLRGWVPSWRVMWILAIVIFAGFKWWTWWRAISNGARTTASRSFAYLVLWPGMDARRFLVLSMWNKSLHFRLGPGLAAKQLSAVF